MDGGLVLLHAVQNVGPAIVITLRQCMEAVTVMAVLRNLPSVIPMTV